MGRRLIERHGRRWAVAAFVYGGVLATCWARSGVAKGVDHAQIARGIAKSIIKSSNEILGSTLGTDVKETFERHLQTRVLSTADKLSQGASALTAEEFAPLVQHRLQLVSSVEVQDIMRGLSGVQTFRRLGFHSQPGSMAQLVIAEILTKSANLGTVKKRDVRKQLVTQAAKHHERLGLLKKKVEDLAVSALTKKNDRAFVEAVLAHNAWIDGDLTAAVLADTGYARAQEQDPEMELYLVAAPMAILQQYPLKKTEVAQAQELVQRRLELAMVRHEDPNDQKKVLFSAASNLHFDLMLSRDVGGDLLKFIEKPRTPEAYAADTVAWRLAVSKVPHGKRPALARLLLAEFGGDLEDIWKQLLSYEQQPSQESASKAASPPVVEDRRALIKRMTDWINKSGASPI